MAKKNSSFGKFIAFTTAIAAVGGACYIFRDQIKESEAFKKTTDKLSALRNKVSNKFSSDEDEFFFDDDFEDDFEDDIFDEDSKSNREYTSITINAKDNNSTATSPEEKGDTEEDAVDIKDATEDFVDDVANDVEELSDAAKDVANDVANAVKEKTEAAKDEVKEIFADDSIPTISFNSNNMNETDETVATDEVLGYENEGLSDVYEDPDVLGDQDKLDF